MNIVLCDYDSAWETDFSHIGKRLLSGLGDIALAVEHVGSTAIPGLCAKPVIDILLVVADSADEATYAPQVEQCGFHFHHREPDWHEQRLFKFRTPAANLHVFSSGCPEIERMLLFRDYLRRDAEARDSYDSKKRELAKKDWTRIQEYADAKSDVVEGLLRAAKA